MLTVYSFDFLIGRKQQLLAEIASLEEKVGALAVEVTQMQVYTLLMCLSVIFDIT